MGGYFVLFFKSELNATRHNRVFISEIAHFGGVGFRQILSFFWRILALVSVSWVSGNVSREVLEETPREVLEEP